MERMWRIAAALILLAACESEFGPGVSYFWRGICTMENGLEWQSVPWKTYDQAYWDAYYNGPDGCTDFDARKFVHREPTTCCGGIDDGEWGA